MRRALACLFLLVCSPLARADRVGGFIYIPPVSLRIVQADAVVAGKVTGVEEKTVRSTLGPAVPELIDYRVFTVKIEQGVKGVKGLTHVKVAIPEPAPPALPPRTRPSPLGGPVKLAKGQEALLFLQQHHKEAFLVPAGFTPIVDKQSASYKTDLDVVVKLGKLLDDPMAGLRSKVDEERYLTAAMLVTKYRTPMPGASKQEAVPVEESKLIMQGLLAGNWDAVQSRTDGFAPMQVFYQLNPQQSGWVAPKDFRQQGPSMKKWLEDNVEKFRVKRFVVEEKK